MGRAGTPLPAAARPPQAFPLTASFA